MTKSEKTFVNETFKSVILSHLCIQTPPPSPLCVLDVNRVTSKASFGRQPSELRVTYFPITGCTSGCNQVQRRFLKGGLVIYRSHE